MGRTGETTRVKILGSKTLDEWMKTEQTQKNQNLSQRWGKPKPSDLHRRHERFYYRNQTLHNYMRKWSSGAGRWEIGGGVSNKSLWTTIRDGHSAVCWEVEKAGECSHWEGRTGAEAPGWPQPLGSYTSAGPSLWWCAWRLCGQQGQRLGRGAEDKLEPPKPFCVCLSPSPPFRERWPPLHFHLAILIPAPLLGPSRKEP